MAATKDDITRWFNEGVRKNHTHLIVICDTYDYDDFPAYVSEGQDVREICMKRNGVNMERVMEVYNLKKPLLEQINKDRCFEY